MMYEHIKAASSLIVRICWYSRAAQRSSHLEPIPIQAKQAQPKWSGALERRDNTMPSILGFSARIPRRFVAPTRVCHTSLATNWRRATLNVYRLGTTSAIIERVTWRLY